MESTDIIQSKYSEEFSEDYSGRLLDEYKKIIPELFDDVKATADKAIEFVRNTNTDFKEIPFDELKNNKKFQQALREYIAKNPIKPPKLEALKSIIPKNHLKPNNKLANNITKNIVDEGEFNLIVSSGKAKKEVFTKVMLAYKTENIQLKGQKYTPYDREVYDGAVTLYAAGNRIITPVMVYRAMNGLTESEYISPQAIEAVAKSLDKIRHIYTIIDYTDEAKMYNKKIEKTTYEGYLLAATKVTVKINGKEHEAYEILSPILYEYARISGQIVSVPIKLLQTKDAVRGTDEVIIIRGYLLRQIEWMRNARVSRSDNITYQKIYEELEVSRIVYDKIQYKKKTAKIRNHVKAILEDWKEQGYIVNYAEYQDGKTLTGIQIML